MKRSFFCLLILFASCCPCKHEQQYGGAWDAGREYFTGINGQYTVPLTVHRMDGWNTEFEINGERIPYDVCSELPLDSAKLSYKEFEYIGSSHVIYINGVRNEFNKLNHFFIKKN